MFKNMKIAQVLLMAFLSVFLPLRADFFVHETGNVGINNEFPQHTLDVSGNVRISNLLNLTPQAVEPSNPSEGSLYLSDKGVLRVYLNGVWQNLAAVASSEVVVEPPAASEFTLSIDTQVVAASSANQFTLPLHPNEAYDFTVDWGDDSGLVAVSSPSDSRTLMLRRVFIRLK